MREKTSEVFKNLENILEEEIKIHRSLLELVRREKEILISAKLDELTSNNKAKEAYILKIKNVDKQRELVARDLAALVGAPTEQPRLLEIAAKMESMENTKLRNIHMTLDLLIKRIKEINISNEALVQSSIKMVNGALGAIKDNFTPRATYAASGDIKKTESVSGAFVSKDA